MREVAAELAAREGQDVTDALLTQLGDHKTHMRQETAQALADIDDDPVSARARRNDPLAGLSDYRGCICGAVANSLAGRDGHDVTDALLARLDDTDKGVLEARAGRDGPDVTDALLALLHDQTTYVRQAAARVLARRKGQDVTDALLARLDDPDESSSRSAGRARFPSGPASADAVRTASNGAVVLHAQRHVPARHTPLPGPFSRDPGDDPPGHDEPLHGVTSCGVVCEDGSSAATPK
jgi:HEAT repeat protein